MLRHPFFSAPHRVMFTAGVAQSLVAMAFWLIDIGARYAGLWSGWSWELPPAWVHAALMLFGVFPFFIFGFLMTTFPKWSGVPALEKPQYLSPFGFLVTGWAIFYGGMANTWLFPAGLVVVAFGWGRAIWTLWTTARTSPNGDIFTVPPHPLALVVALTLGVAGVVALAYGIHGFDPFWVRTGMDLGLWGCLLPVFLVVSHRMLPVFSAAAISNYVIYRSLPVLLVVLGAFAVYGILDVSGLTAWLWLPDLVAAGGVGLLTIKWQLSRSFASRLLATHHLAGLWLLAGLLLDAAQSLILASGGERWGGLAPLHALTLGYFGSMVIGMITRVTLGHSGRMINSDRYAWPLFWVLQVVVTLRLAGDFVTLPGMYNPLFWASAGWLVVFGVWAAHHLPMLLSARPDGRPG
ncbi:MAG: NnrS family protein [Betaproteobacteria bacterium]